MALPIAPFAVTAARYGTIAAVAYLASRRINRSQTHQGTEDAMDRVDEGLSANRPTDRQQVNGSVRYRRIIRIGRRGPGVEVDIVGLGRIKFRRV